MECDIAFILIGNTCELKHTGDGSRMWELSAVGLNNPDNSSEPKSELRSQPIQRKLFKFRYKYSKENT